MPSTVTICWAIFVVPVRSDEAPVVICKAIWNQNIKMSHGVSNQLKNIGRVSKSPFTSYTLCLSHGVCVICYANFSLSCMAIREGHIIHSVQVCFATHERKSL